MIRSRGDRSIPGEFADTAVPRRPAPQSRHHCRSSANCATIPSSDTTRNPYMMYQPMTRLGNLVTEHSDVFAVWVTVGYFEVEKAPDWNDPDTCKQRLARFGSGSAATTTDTDAAYDRRPRPLRPRLSRRLRARPGSRQRHRQHQAATRLLHHRPHHPRRLQAGRGPQRRPRHQSPPPHRVTP